MGKGSTLQDGDRQLQLSIFSVLSCLSITSYMHTACMALELQFILIQVRVEDAHIFVWISIVLLERLDIDCSSKFHMDM